jgi:hypothetical protein
MILAEATPSPQAISQLWIVVATGLGVLSCGVSIVTSIIMVSSNKKQRREVTFGFEPASKADVEKLATENKREHENIFSKVYGIERGAQAKLEAAISSGNVSREKLHARINTCSDTMSELRGTINELRGTIQTLLNKLK